MPIRLDDSDESPPPSYPSLYPPDLVRTVTECTALLAGKAKKRTASCVSSPIGRVFLAAFGAVLFALFLAQNAGLARCPLNDVPAAEKAELRKLWNREAEVHAANLAMWAHERAEHEAETRDWTHEREEWAMQRAEWARERAEEERHRLEVRRRSQGVYWTEPAGDHRCHSWGTRTYTAYLKDVPGDLNWLEVCDNMPPVVIHGRELSKPDKCERNGRGEIQGAWWKCPLGLGVHHAYSARTHPTIRQGCAPTRSGYLRYEARLNGIQDKDDWEMMCQTAPATIEHTHYDRPDHCENRGMFGGMVGIWDHPTTSWWCR